MYAPAMTSTSRRVRDAVTTITKSNVICTSRAKSERTAEPPVAQRAEAAAKPTKVVSVARSGVGIRRRSGGSRACSRCSSQAAASSAPSGFATVPDAIPNGSSSGNVSTMNAARSQTRLRAASATRMHPPTA